MPYFYKRDDITRKSNHNDIVEKELSKDDYFSVIVKGIERNARKEYKYNHDDCFFNTDRRTEKRLCRCLVCYNKNPKVARCNDCALKTNEYFAKTIKNATFIDFEVPVSSNGKDHVGEIDLLMEYDNDLYCVEFKPLWNGESLLRMVAEILTYTYVLEKDKTFFEEKYNVGHPYKKAIMFVYNSEQYKQWTEKKYSYYACDRLREIIKAEEIAVFCLKLENNEYMVEKLN